MSKKSGKSVVKSSGKKNKVKPSPKLLSVYALARTATETVWANKGLFAGITLVYGLLNLLLVQGLANHSDTTELKNTLDQIFTGQFAGFASGLSVFAVMLSSAGNASSQTAGVYQLILTLIGSLAMIWALRQVLTGAKLRVRDPYYKGIYPLIPFTLVLMVVAIQLLPLLIGSSIYAIVINNGIAVMLIEKLLWAILFAGLAIASLYMLSSSLFALYIVTLPDMAPINALKSARELVRGRRWTVLRKIICLPIILLIVAAIIMVPIIVWLTPLAQWIFFILTMSALLAIHAYMYTLYRELLNE